MLVRKSRSLRQCSWRETITSVRYGAAATQSSNSIAKESATSAKSRRSVSASTGSPTAKSMRMKNRPESRSPYCWLSRMLPPRRTRKPLTACTIPGRSGQESTSTKSPAAAVAGAVP